MQKDSFVWLNVLGFGFVVLLVLACGRQGEKEYEPSNGTENLDKLQERLRDQEWKRLLEVVGNATAVAIAPREGSVILEVAYPLEAGGNKLPILDALFYQKIREFVRDNGRIALRARNGNLVAFDENGMEHTLRRASPIIEIE